jgi:hypothetical protein
LDNFDLLLDLLKLKIVPLFILKVHHTPMVCGLSNKIKGKGGREGGIIVWTNFKS